MGLDGYLVHTSPMAAATSFWEELILESRELSNTQAAGVRQEILYPLYGFLSFLILSKPEGRVFGHFSNFYLETGLPKKKKS